MSAESHVDTEGGDQPERDQEALADLAEAFCQEIRCGGHADVEEYAARLPALADQIREVFPPLAMLEKGGLGLEARRGTRTAPRSPGDDSGGFLAHLSQRFGPAVDPGITLEEKRATGTVAGEVLDRLSAREGALKRYDPRGEIGRGGQGAVLAVWDEDLRRNIAMKVLLADERGTPRASPGGTRALARFLEEAQVTAQLDHPGIVPVHDLGLASRGEVFFTMKLVKGEDLRAIFALVREAREGWTRTRALHVMLKLCEAMAYAHSKGVIHRDLKPANVMVGKFGEVYVMDWGLARVLAAEDRKDIRIRPGPASEIASSRRAPSGAVDSPLFTMDGDVVGTPAYMPPEQARGELAAVGPHSDVYAVGAMLYQLLTGQMPYVPAGSTIGNREVWELVKKGPPPPVHALAADVPGELAAICDKAMAREPGQRYRDMGELAEDLRAYLERRVVSAYETGALAELRKWIARNKALAAACVTVALALVAGLITSLVFRARAVAQADVSAAVVDFLTEDMIGAAATRRFGTGAVGGGMGWDATLREAVEAAAVKLDQAADPGGRFETKPLVEARIRSSIGWVFLSVGKYAEAISHYERAHELYARELGESSREALEAARGLGSLLCETGQVDRAEACLDRAGDLARSSLGEGDRETLWILAMLANTMTWQGRMADSERLHEEVLRGCRANLPPGDPLTLGELHNLALAALDAGRLDAAEARYLEALDLQTQFMGPDDSQTMSTRSNLGQLYRTTGKLDQARVHLELALDGLRRTCPPTEPTLLRTLMRLILLHEQRGDAETARPLTRELLAGLGERARAGAQDPEAMNNFARQLLTTFPEDLRDPSAAVEPARAACAATSYENWGYLDTLALALYETGDTPEAVTMQRQALALCPEGAPARAEIAERLARFEAAQAPEGVIGRE